MEQLFKISAQAAEDVPISDVDKYVEDDSMTGNSAVISGQMTARQNTAKTAKKRAIDIDSIESD